MNTTPLICEVCGTQGRRYRRGLCGSCALAEDLHAVLDDGIDTLVTASWGRTGMTVLSVVGFYNVMFLAYNVALNLLATNVVHFPSWLAV